MAISRLTSKENSLIKTIKLVSSGARRAPAGLAAAEGIRVLGEVAACGCRIEASLISEDFGASGKEEALLQSWISQGVRICRASESLFRSVSDVRAPQGAIALVHLPERRIETVALGQNPLVVIACGVQDPGNLGTIIRAAAAAGATLVCTARNTVSPRNPKAVRASAGSVFRIPVVENAEISRVLSFCRSRSIQAFRTDVHEGMPYTLADLKSPCAIVLGNEGGGITDGGCSGLPAIRIPMVEAIESLNVAIAGAIIFFEALRQRSQS